MLNDLKKDIDIAISLPIKHISYYSLLIEENTILWAKKEKDVDDNIQARMYRYIYNRLRKSGFNRYEISNFAKDEKYQSYHNKIYWKNKHYDAIGLASSGYVDNIRYTNNDNIIKYNKGEFFHIDETILSKEDIMFDEIMLALRLDEGLNIKMFNEKFDVDFKEKYKKAISENIQNRLIVIEDDIIKTTFKGSLLLNDVLQCFLDD